MKTTQDKYDEIKHIVENAARDTYGVFYDAQSVLQNIADVLGMSAPDRAKAIVAFNSRLTEYARLNENARLPENELEIECCAMSGDERAAIEEGSMVHAIRLIKRRTGRGLAQSTQIACAFRDRYVKKSGKY